MAFIRLSGFKDRIGFISVLDFLGYLSCSNTAETSKTELRPFLTIFGTGMRAITSSALSLIPQSSIGFELLTLLEENAQVARKTVKVVH